MSIVNEILKEHDLMRVILDDMLSSNEILLGDMLKLKDIWDKHEEKEENFFTSLGRSFPVSKMQLQHKELKGHWKVLMDAVQSKDNNRISLALDTDGRMLAKKLINHMDSEEKLFKNKEILQAD